MHADLCRWQYGPLTEPRSAGMLRDAVVIGCRGQRRKDGGEEF